MIFTKESQTGDAKNEIPKVVFSTTHGALPHISPEIRKLWEMLGELSPVVPASSIIPDWYVKLKKYYINDFDKSHDRRNEEYVKGVYPTVKRCPGIFDFLRAGYIVPAWSDFLVRWDGTNNPAIFEESVAMKEISNKSFTIQHSAYFENDINYEYPQAEGAPFLNDSCKDILKLITPWCVDTSEGISLLFLQPYYHNSTDITIMPGMLDTDIEYINNKHISIFLKINSPNKDIFIERGTPLLQVIPFKRTDYKFECITRPTKEMIRNFEVLGMELHTKFRNVSDDDAKKMSEELKCPFGNSMLDPNRRNAKMVHNRKQDGKNYNKKD